MASKIWLLWQQPIISQRPAVRTTLLQHKNYLSGKGVLLCNSGKKINIKNVGSTNSKSVRGKKQEQERIVVEKRRTRSQRELDENLLSCHLFQAPHVPVLLGEVLDVFHAHKLRSFVDCTLGAGGHSSVIIRDHPELQSFIGLDIDPIALEKAQSHIDAILCNDLRSSSNLKTYTLLKNFKCIKSVLCEVDENIIDNGVDGIFMDLGLSSMQVNNPERGFSVLNDGPLDMRMNPQASLTAEEIVNFWPEAEVGRILHEYGEESNWHFLQNKIVKARSKGGLHSTGELVQLVKRTSGRSGRQGWIKTATRVFQALRIAVNDELKTLEDTLYACFDCLSSGGRLAVISFHSLEDRIVKHTFLDIINRGDGDMEKLIDVGAKESLHKESLGGNDGSRLTKMPMTLSEEGDKVEESWIKQKIEGRVGTILTKRPITPSTEEERLNRRARSAKLRVIQKA